MMPSSSQEEIPPPPPPPPSSQTPTQQTPHTDYPSLGEKKEKSKDHLLMALPEDHLGWERNGQKEDSKALVTVDGEGVDWTNHSEDEDYALMACNSLDSDTEMECMLYPTHDREFYASGPDIEIDCSTVYICTEPSELVSEPVVNESNVECQPKVWSDAPIIEEYESDSEDECVSIPTKQQETPSFANKQVKTPRETVKNQYTHSQKPKVDKTELGYGFTVRACFVCGSLNHLIRDCDFHEKRMARKAELNNGWNNVQRVNKQNQFVPSAVLTRTGIIPVNTARTSGTKNFSTARQSVNRQTVLTSTAMKVNTVKPIVNRVRPANVFYKTHSSSSRPFKKPTVLRTDFSKQKVNTAKVNAVSTVGGKRETAVKPSAGCNWRPQRYHGGSKYNGSNLRNCYTFKDPLGRLKPKQAWWMFQAHDWDHGLTLMNFARSLMVALLLLWSYLMKINVLLKTLDIQLVPVSFGDIVPTGGWLLIAKATTDESNKWHRRLGHVNFKNLKYILVQGKPCQRYRRDYLHVGDSDKEDDSAQTMFGRLPIWPSYSLTNTPAVTTNDKRAGPREEEQVFMDDLERLKNQEKEAYEEAEALRKKFETLVIKEGAAKPSSTNIFSTVSTPANC
ncbi:hypothetical protein Tco_1155735 [Tanacetum coccineum]